MLEIFKDQQVKLVLQEKKVILVNKDLLELKDLQVLLVQLVLKDLQGIQVYKDLKVILVFKDLQELKDLQDLKDLLVLMDTHLHLMILHLIN